MRAFISVKLTPKILMEVNRIQEALPEFTGKKTEIKNLHLTLKFLGEISSENTEKVKLKLKEINFSKFEAEIGEMGFFDNFNKGIVWISLSNFENLQREIDSVLAELFPKEKRFMGHLTIARVKKFTDVPKKEFINRLKELKVPKMFFTVDKFYLMKSKLSKEGPTYSVIEEYTLN